MVIADDANKEVWTGEDVEYALTRETWLSKITNNLPENPV
jgi:hypothetical protein